MHVYAVLVLWKWADAEETADNYGAEWMGRALKLTRSLEDRGSSFSGNQKQQLL